MTLRVILQIVPFGDEERVREIGRVDISNMGGMPKAKYALPSEGTWCSYRVRYNGKEHPHRVAHPREAGALLLAAEALHFANDLYVEGTGQ